MKEIVVLIFGFITFTSLSQSKEFLVLDSLTKKPINLVHISYLDLSIGSISNVDGKIKIPLKKESLLISHINYKDKTLNYKDFITKDSLFLTQKSMELEEVVVSNIKLKEKLSLILGNYKNIYSTTKNINHCTYKETFKVNDSLSRLFQTQIKWWSKNSLLTFKKPMEKQNKITIENVDYSKVKKINKNLLNSNGGYVQNKEFFKLLHLNFLLTLLTENTDDFFIHSIKKTSNNTTIIFDAVLYQNKTKIFEFVDSKLTFTTDYSAITYLKLNMHYNTDFAEKTSKDSKITYKTKTTENNIELSFKKLNNNKLSINYYILKIEGIIKVNDRVDTIVGSQSLFVTRNELGKKLKGNTIINFNEPFYNSIPENQTKTSSKLLLSKEEVSFINNIN